MDERSRRVAEAAIGFMPPDEGLALYEAGLAGGRVGPMVEIGSYCGKSTVYLGAAAREVGSLLFSIDHHRGSEEHQPGEEFHDERLVDGDGRVDTLPEFRATIAAAGLGDVVIPVVARSEELAKGWREPIGFVFIDGGHSRAAAHADLDAWAPLLLPAGILAIHDVFPDPAEGGRPPYEIYLRALDSDRFREISSTGSLRVLQRSEN
jgi:predicted O-methyltransferase YrrM